MHHEAASIVTESAKCSLIAREKGLDPIGTAAGGYERHLFVETPLPWPRDVMQSPSLPKALVELVTRSRQEGRPARLLGIVPDPAYSLPGHTRVIHARRPVGLFTEFFVDEWVVPDERLDAFAQALGGLPHELREFAAYRRERQGVRDFLICTQGSRDACCGKFGYELYRVLRDKAGQMGDSDVRIWRVSHLGGHRFAPTVIELPQMRQWGYVAPDVAAAILARSGEFGEVHQHYRGWAGLSSPWEQALEREALVREGWGATGYPMSGRVVEVSADKRSARVELALDLPGGGVKRYEGVVEVIDTIAGPESCRSDGVTEFPCYRVTQINVHEEDEPTQATS